MLSTAELPNSLGKIPMPVPGASISNLCEVGALPALSLSPLMAACS